jgi:hypothetical protein
VTLDETNVAAYADTLVLQVKGSGRELDYSDASVATLEDLLRISDPLLAAENFPTRSATSSRSITAATWAR